MWAVECMFGWSDRRYETQSKEQGKTVHILSPGKKKIGTQ